MYFLYIYISCWHSNTAIPEISDSLANTRYSRIRPLTNKKNAELAKVVKISINTFIEPIEGPYDERFGNVEGGHI
jgi:hypothetical protein